MDILQQAKDTFDYMVQHRRHIHRHPELTGKEDQTVAYILEQLKTLNIPTIEVENGGVLGFIKGQKSGKRVVLRADIDALPVQEPENNLKGPRVCVSENPGVMHACGHDSHTAMLLGAAKILSENKEVITGEVMLVFERGEEGGGNLRFIMEYLEEHHITFDGAWALHVFQDMPTGMLGIRPGGVMAGAIALRYKIIGRGGHGSRPDLSINPIDCMLALLDEIYKAPMKFTHPFEPVTFSIAKIQSGHVHNVIPDVAEFAGSIRFFHTEKTAKPLVAYLHEMTETFAKLYRCEIEYTIKVGRPTINDPTATQIARNAVAEVLGAEWITEGEPAMGSESFPAFANYAPSFYGKLGITNPEVGSGAEIHNQFFDIDEKAMIHGAAATVAFALAFLNHEQPIAFKPYPYSVAEYYAGK